MYTEERVPHLIYVMCVVRQISYIKSPWHIRCIDYCLFVFWFFGFLVFKLKSKRFNTAIIKSMKEFFKKMKKLDIPVSIHRCIYSILYYDLK
jgi:hypothetical protein